MSTLLVVGAWAVDDLAEFPGTVGGWGGYAAIAAAPLAPTQCWGRGGADLPKQVLALLTQRGIDLAGVDWSGPDLTSTNCDPVDALGSFDISDAHEVGAVLFAGLPAADLRRARSACRAVKNLAAVPQWACLRSADVAASLAEIEDMEVVAVSHRAGDALNIRDPLILARRLQNAGSKIAVVTAGPFGGLVAYQQKTTTWPALPVEETADVGGALPAFTGALAAWCAGSDKADFSTLKRGLAVASAVGGLAARGPGTRRLLSSNRAAYLEAWTKLKREAKS